MRRQAILATAALVAALVACGRSSGAAEPTAALPTAFVAPRPTSSEIVVAPLATSPARAKPVPLATPLPPTSAASPTSTQAVEVPTATSAAAPTGDQALQEALLVAEINRARAANGLPPYLHNPEISVAARAHSCDMAAHALISHTSSDGRTLPQRLEGATPAWEWPSENIAAGLAEPAAIVAMWMDEPPEGWHRRNILDPDQREVGAGYCYASDDPSGNHHYWTADFSRRAS